MTIFQILQSKSRACEIRDWHSLSTEYGQLLALIWQAKVAWPLFLWPDDNHNRLRQTEMHMLPPCRTFDSIQVGHGCSAATVDNNAAPALQLAGCSLDCIHMHLHVRA